MAVFETLLKSDLKKPVTVQALQGVVFTADSAGNRVTVEVTDGGSPAALSGTVTGYVIRADGGTLAVTGTLSGNKASIVLPASAYAVPGPMQIAIRLTAGSVKTVLGACSGYVQRSTTDTVIDPGHVIPSLEELLAQIAVMEQATADAEAATSAANTAASNANTKANAANTAASNANTKAAAADTAAAAANQAAQNANQAAQGIQQYNNRITALETGKVAKTGDEMTGPLTVNVGGGTSALDIKASEAAYRGVSFRYRLAEALGVARAVLYQFKSNNTNYDLFKLPATTVGDTANGEYDILTTKDAVTVPQGGTGAATPAGACESLGAVKKSGDTMTGGLTAPKFTNSDVDYVVQRAGSGFRQGILRMVNASTTHKWQLIQMKANNTNFDGFSLPATTDSDTTNQSYDILTTKTANVAVSAANGATVGNPGTCRKVGNLLYINLRITVPSNFTGAEIQCATFSSGFSSSLSIYDRVLGPAGEVVGVHITSSGVGLLGASSALAGKQVLINTLIMDA